MEATLTRLVFVAGGVKHRTNRESVSWNTHVTTSWPQYPLLTLNKNLSVGPLYKSITQGQANAESSTGWKFRNIARDNRILADPLLGPSRPVPSLKSDEVLHPFFARDTADSQVDILSRWDYRWSDISDFEWFWKESENMCYWTI